MAAFIGLWVLLALAIPVAAIVALILALDVRSRVRRLEERLKTLEGTRVVSDARAAEAPASVAEAPAPAPAVAAPPGVPPAAPRPFVLKPRPPPEPAPAPEPAAALPPGPTGVARLEGLLGERWLNRVGALVLVVGIGFFLKYAFENRWIGPAGRVLIGLLAGVAFLGVGERLQRAAYRVPAQGLAAAGIATLYLSVYAAWGFYELVPRSVAFGLLVLVAATGMAIAIRHDARVIAFLATLGGLLTPVLLRGEYDAAVALFTYLAVLDAGALAAACWRRWPEVSLLAFAGTQALYWAWFDEWYRPEKLAVALLGPSVFFVLFALTGPAEAARGGGLRWSAALLTLATPTAYFVAARGVLWPEYPGVLALLCLGLATVYLGLGRWAIHALPGAPDVALLHFALALAFLTLTFPVQFTEHTTAIAWSVEGAALLWGGFRRAAPRLRASALAVLGLAAVRWLTLLWRPAWHEGRFLVDHPLALPTVFVVAACTVAAWLYRRRESDAAGWEAAARPLLVLAALGGAALFLGDEVAAYGPFRRGLPAAHRHALGLLPWIAAALPLLWLARGDRTRILFAATTALLALLGLVATTTLADEWRRLAPALRPAALNLRFVTGLLIAALYALYARLAPELPISDAARRRARALGGAAAALLLLWHLSTEVTLLPLAALGRGEADKARSMGLSLLWTLYALAAMGVGMRWHLTAVRLGALGLFGLTVAKVFLVDLAELDAVYRILSFLVLGGVLLLASFLYTRYRRGRDAAGPSPPPGERGG